VVQVGREVNNIAYCLAKEASTHVIDNVYLEEIPSFILHIVLREFSFPEILIWDQLCIFTIHTTNSFLLFSLSLSFFHSLSLSLSL